MISDVGRWVGQRGSDVRCAIINEKETNQKELKKNRGYGKVESYEFPQECKFFKIY